LYTQHDAVRAAKRFRSISYNQKFCLAKDIFVTLYESGHILGSSVIALEIKDGNGVTHIGYAVDLGRKGLPLLNDPVAPEGLDYLILESTYGGRIHASIEEGKKKFAEVIRRTVERKGKILIPSFALERTQEVLYFLNEFFREKIIPAVPIYVDSPLACDITDVFKFHQSYFDKDTRQAIKEGNSPFEFLNLKYIRAQKDSKRLNDNKHPMIIIAGSGMCESGRILHHLKNNIEDSRNTILVVGYMAQDTLGRRIVERERFVKIFGVEYELNAEVVVINAFSGHADKIGLCAFVSQCLPLKKVFIVHGDLDQSQNLSDALKQSGVEAYIPSEGEEVLLS
ncbi:MAG: MBL fold metallo-hydrolase, partial [Candidatus Omnitrophica bacterium]|nr:MBL fold metallo-hydrolase [Candidatus Omnitrophota bacterium]